MLGIRKRKVQIFFYFGGFTVSLRLKKHLNKNSRYFNPGKQAYIIYLRCSRHHISLGGEIIIAQGKK